MQFHIFSRFSCIKKLKPQHCGFSQKPEVTIIAVVKLLNSCAIFALKHKVLRLSANFSRFNLIKLIRIRICQVNLQENIRKRIERAPRQRFLMEKVEIVRVEFRTNSVNL